MTRRITAHVNPGTDPLIAPLLTVLLALTGRARRGWRERSRDTGLGTLELVIITLGLMAVAALAVAAITTAVRTRTNRIK